MHLPRSYHLNFTITYAWPLAIHYGTWNRFLVISGNKRVVLSKIICVNTPKKVNINEILQPGDQNWLARPINCIILIADVCVASVYERHGILTYWRRPLLFACGSFGMALYYFCQQSIHNKKFSHGCYAISIVYQSMLMFIMSCVMNMVTQMIQVQISVHCAFGLALLFYLSIRRVGDPGMLE